MTALWIAAIVLAFVVGIALGPLILIRKFKEELKNPKSGAAKILGSAFDKIDNEAIESAAKGAEMYQESHRCLNNCGAEIARMLRETSKGS